VPFSYTLSNGEVVEGTRQVLDFTQPSAASLITNYYTNTSQTY